MLKLMILMSIYLHQKNIQLDINIDKYNERNSEILPRDDETATPIPKPEIFAKNTVLPHRLAVHRSIVITGSHRQLRSFIQQKDITKQYQYKMPLQNSNESKLKPPGQKAASAQRVEWQNKNKRII